MAKRILVFLFGAFAYRAQAIQDSELQCIGRVAHLVTYTLDGEQFSAVSVQPAPERNEECDLNGRLGSNFGKDRHICMGVNQDDTCAAARPGSVPLPFGTRCQDCFVGMETDLFYTVNISKLRLRSVGVGLRGTQLHSKIQIMDDKGTAPPPKTRSIKFGEKQHEWQLKLLGHVVATFRISMPTELYYEDAIRANAHTDVGANLDIDLGENFVEYTEGKGWKHHRDKAKITVVPVAEGDDDIQGTLKFGLNSSVQVEVVDVLWYHLNVAPEITTQVVSIGDSAASDLIHTCVTGGIRYDASHEADIHMKLANFSIEKHIGPAMDKNYSNSNLTHKCFDIHRRKPEIMVI